MPKIRAAIALALLLTVFSPLRGKAAGPLAPPGPPAPMWKTLQEIEPRTLISALPFTITTPGSYYLSNSLTVPIGNAITIQSDGVTLDLNGATLYSSAASATGSGVFINGSYKNIAILNGSVQGGVTNNGGGTYAGPGFAYGIYGPSSANVRVSGVAVSGCLNSGIYLNLNASLVETCTVNTLGNYGIYAQVVARCTALDCGSTAIECRAASDCIGACPYGATGISAVTVLNCYGTSGSGDGISASDAENSYGSSNTGVGLNATTANNCYGYSSTTNEYGMIATDAVGCFGQGGYVGLYCYSSAHACTGASSYGYGINSPVVENSYGLSYYYGTANSYAGIYATIAINSYGLSGDSAAGSYNNYGLQAQSAHNCYGISNYGIGINARANNGTVESCYGTSTSDYGIYANTANNCYGYSQNQSGMYADSAQNCYGESQTGDGLDAGVANNCTGYSHNGYYGINAGEASNCYGYCPATGASGAGIIATLANNCYGFCSRTSADGLSVTIAIGCYGYDTAAGSYGVFATIGNSCAGSSENIANKYNMP